MGNAASRKEHKENLPPQIVTQDQDCGDLDEGQGQGDTPMETNGDTPVLLKSRAHIMALVDPRSPTQEISRTPIALEDQKPTRRESLLNSKLAKLRESTPNTPILNPFFDPRSPTEDIDRTPIRYKKGTDGLAPSTKINFQA